MNYRRTSKDIIGGIREMDTAIQNLKIGFVKVYEDVYTRHFYSAPNKKKAKSAEPAAAAIDKKATDSAPSSSHNSSKGNNDYEDMEVVRGVLEIVTSAATNTEKELAESEAQPLPASAKEEDGEQLENPEDGEQLQPTYREQMNQAFRESFFGIQKGDQQQESGGAEEGSPTTAAEKGEKEEAAAMSDTPTETLDVTIELPETSFANGTGGDGEEGDEDERTIPDYDEYDDERLDEEEIEDYNWDEVLDEAGKPATFLILQKLK